MTEVENLFPSLWFRKIVPIILGLACCLKQTQFDERS